MRHRSLRQISELKNKIEYKYTIRAIRQSPLKKDTSHNTNNHRDSRVNINLFWGNTWIMPRELLWSLERWFGATTLGFLRAFLCVSTLLWNCFLCWDRWNSMWRLHLTQPCYVALGWFWSGFYYHVLKQTIWLQLKNHDLIGSRNGWIRTRDRYERFKF